MNTDLDTLLTALYVELDDCIIPSHGPRFGPGHPLKVMKDAERVCLAVAQVLLLRFNDERSWLRSAPPWSGTSFRGCCRKASTTGACVQRAT